METVLFVIGIGGFLGLLVAGSQGGPSAPWLRAAAAVWFIVATLVRSVLAACADRSGGGQADEGRDGWTGAAGAGPGARGATLPWGLR